MLGLNEPTITIDAPSCSIVCIVLSHYTLSAARLSSPLLPVGDTISLFPVMLGEHGTKRASALGGSPFVRLRQDRSTP